MVKKNELLNFQLPSGKLLRDATKTEVIEAAKFYEKRAKEFSVKAEELLKSQSQN